MSAAPRMGSVDRNVLIDKLEQMDLSRSPRWGT